MNGVTDDERRTESRLAAEATVFVEIRTGEPETREPASICICSSMDVSTGGIQLRLDQPVFAGTILRLCAEFPDGRDPLLLVGEVKWSRSEGQEFLAGFALYDSEQTDFAAWKDLIATRF